MNRTLIVAALTALSAGASFAQSGVTIYGRFNVTAEQQDSNGKKTKVLANDASRIGFKGTEDLGGGLKAGFTLEHGFNVDTGTQSQTAFWARQSEVNLGSASAGVLRLGNFTSEAYYATADYVSMHNHDTGSSSDALYAYIGRNTNKIAYRAPEFVKGLSAEVAVSAAETTPNAKRTWDGAVNYNLGALQLGLGYEKNGDANQVGVRALYEMGPFIVGGYVQRDEDGYGAKLGTRTTFRLAGAYMLGSSEFHLNYGHAGEYSNLADSDANQYTVGYNYNLSKRTKVYGYVTKVDDSAKKVYGGDFTSYAVGLRHNF